MDLFNRTLLLILVLAALIGIFGGIGCLIVSLRHKQPEIDWAWFLRTRLSAINLTSRGQTLRRKGWRWLFAGVLCYVAAGTFNKFVAKIPTRRPAASAPAPTD
ncbi:MAG: hypothetical protein HUU22_00700 [Phycisphaerae bacterium]|nr:hypothetical protein [Phycisphaerae bacterium]NUQ44533.1 hypothetical protein [Phycisphaerae bacterium]